jgi:ABC-type bacteriocin/lantibiotic exporter with double-glycine peptidase domain
VFESGARYHRLSAFVSAMPLMVVQTLIVALLWIGQYFQLSGAALFAIVLIMSSWRSALARVFQLGQIWEKGLLSLEKMALLLQRPVAIEGNEKLGTGADWLLEIEGMEYGGASPFFLRVHPGERHVIVGPNAAGKTTLVKLLAGLYRPSAGEIRWNGMPVEAFTLHSRRQKVAVVSDAFPLSGETLLDAISKGSGPTAQADARQLFEKWQAHLPALKGLDLAQSLNGNAIALSGGQSRILQCLRAVLADKPIWILDEPLAGLDDCSAIFLQNTMAQWPSDKAILVFTTQKNTQKEMGQVTFLNGADIVSNINH